jgi:hypothetical protein
MHLILFIKVHEIEIVYMHFFSNEFNEVGDQMSKRIWKSRYTTSPLKKILTNLEVPELI